MHSRATTSILSPPDATTPPQGLTHGGRTRGGRRRPLRGQAAAGGVRPHPSASDGVRRAQPRGPGGGAVVGPAAHHPPFLRHVGTRHRLLLLVTAAQMQQLPTAAQIRQLPTAAQIRQLLTATVSLPAAPPTRAAPPAVKIESWDDEAGTTREKEGSGDAVKGDAAMQAREMRLLHRRGRYAATRAREMRRHHG